MAHHVVVLKTADMAKRVAQVAAHHAINHSVATKADGDSMTHNGKDASLTATSHVPGELTIEWDTAD
jgi:hypothetical protein